jgi:hypothetical protein
VLEALRMTAARSARARTGAFAHGPSEELEALITRRLPRIMARD